jgi:hypothetical protein
MLTAQAQLSLTVAGSRTTLCEPHEKLWRSFLHGRMPISISSHRLSLIFLPNAMSELEEASFGEKTMVHTWTDRTWRSAEVEPSACSKETLAQKQKTAADRTVIVTSHFTSDNENFSCLRRFNSWYLRQMTHHYRPVDYSKRQTGLKSLALRIFLFFPSVFQKLTERNILRRSSAVKVYCL